MAGLGWPEQLASPNGLSSAAAAAAKARDNEFKTHDLSVLSLT